MEGGAPDPTWASDEAAAAYRRGEALRSRAFAAATELMLDLADLCPGDRVLDVAAGTGEQTVLAARRVGPTGSVLAADVAPSMLSVAAERARQLGLANVATEALDAR